MAAEAFLRDWHVVISMDIWPVCDGLLCACATPSPACCSQGHAFPGTGSTPRQWRSGRLNPSRGVRPSRPVSGMQPGFSSHVWGASGCLRLGLCSLVPAARVCLTLRMQGTGRGERWECDPQMDVPLRAPPSPEGHRATGIFQNELPWQVPRAPPLRVPHARTVPGEPPPAPSGRLCLGLARPLLSDRLGWVSQGPLPASPRGCHLGRGICTYLTVLCT